MFLDSTALFEKSAIHGVNINYKDNNWACVGC
jgi:hypothetical protein